jgi:hypothetical protein
MSKATISAATKAEKIKVFTCSRTRLLGKVLPVILAGMVSTGLSAPVSTASLLEEMVSLDKLAEFPNPSYTCKQFSSYDRASKSPDEEWFANGDAGQFMRVEDKAGRKEHVMAEMDGPGAIVRIWSANPAGTLRIYIDGAETPEIEAPMSDILGGNFPGWPVPIAGERSKGWNLYFPIPYARSCKVTSDKGGFYYHVNYRTYGNSTRVEPFTRAQLGNLSTQIGRVARILAEPRSLKSSLRSEEHPLSVALEPGESASREFFGPAAITRAVTRVTAANTEEALRGVILKMKFDGQDCIEVPLGDFFGSAPGINPFETLPVGMTSSGELYSQWVMPFRESAVLEVVNLTKKKVSLEGQLSVAPYKWTPRSMHFHAGWRVDWEVPTRPMQDWNYLTAKGQGVFAGASLAIDNPVRDWWGEGDEKIYVDGEEFPSHFGTGTEDYFGYAWCWPGLCTHAYHSQARCDGPRNYGRTSVNRFHIIDAIPFNKSLKFDMELWHWHQDCKVNMAVTTYWYARPGGSSEYKAITARDAQVRPLPAYVVPKVAGAIEGETMKIIQVDGKADPQDWSSLSSEQHLWWHVGVKPGATLTLGFPAPSAGKYKVFGRFLTARDYGIHQLSINGVPAGKPIDFYNPEVTPTEERELGTFDLKAGENQITIKAAGKNEKAAPQYMFGLDYLLLRQ